jgi:glycosyltransferase involved in cell wall biosynthesis
VRVLHLIDSFLPGGAERSLNELVPRFEAAGVRCDVVALTRLTGDVQITETERTYEARFCSATTLPGRVAELRRIIRAERPDMVHTTLFRSDVHGRLAAWRTPARVLTSLVNTSYEPARLADPNVRRSRLAAARELDGWTARHLTDHFHAITRAAADSAVRHLRIDPARITVIPRGRDEARLGRPGPQRRAAVRAALGLPADATVLCTVGRQDPQKGHDVLLAAFDRLAAARPEVWLLVVGRAGHATPALEAHLSRSPAAVRERVRLLGHRRDVGDLLAASDVFVFPSRYEGLGGAVVEALALALPVVASDLPALREVVTPDREGLLVPPGDPAALAAAVAHLLASPQRRAEMGAAARRRFEEAFSLDRVAEAMIALYERVAGTVSPPAPT